MALEFLLGGGCIAAAQQLRVLTHVLDGLRRCGGVGTGNRGTFAFVLMDEEEEEDDRLMIAFVVACCCVGAMMRKGGRTCAKALSHRGVADVVEE